MAQDQRADQRQLTSYFLLLLTLLGGQCLLRDGKLDLVVEHGKHHCKLDAIQLTVADYHVLGAARFLKGRERLLLKDTRVDEGFHTLHSFVQLFDELEVLEEGLHAL